jgi:hypothetical protein
MNLRTSIPLQDQQCASQAGECQAKEDADYPHKALMWDRVTFWRLRPVLEVTEEASVHHARCERPRSRLIGSSGRPVPTASHGAVYKKEPSDPVVQQKR